MATEYNYTARDKNGATDAGTILAADRAAAVADLNKRGLTPVKLAEVGAEKERRAMSGLFYSLPFSKKVKAQDKAVFSRQLATMIASDIPIGRALTILEEQSESPKIKKMAGDLAKQVEGGASLAKAMGDHKDIVSDVYVSMINAGESGGILNDVLGRLAEQEEKDAEIKSRVEGVLLYPAILAIASLIAFGFMLTVIIPKISGIFTDLGVEMPAYTKAMLGLSRFISGYWLVILGALVAAVFGWRLWRATPIGKKSVDALVLKLPIIGRLVTKMNVARFARTFGSLMSAGTPLPEALSTAGEALHNSFYRAEVARLAEVVKNGDSISDQIRGSRLFPPIVSQMIVIGEETGKLNEILIRLAGFYEREVDATVNGLTAIIEPVIIIVLGIVVGFLAISIVGPINAISQAI